MLEHLSSFVRKTTSKSQRCCDVSMRSEIRRRKRNVLTMLVFGRSNNVGNTTLSDVATKTQPNPNVVTTSCAS